LLAVSFNWVITSTVEAADHSSDFIGSDRCIECHQQEYADWRQSDHRKAMQPADKDNVLGDFDNVTVEFHDIETRLFQQGNNFRVVTTGLNGDLQQFEIKYTFGHYPLQQYLVDIGNGYLQALNIAWDSRSSAEGGQRWFHLQANEDIDPEHPFFWTRHFQNSNSRCIECHSTDFRKNYDPENSNYETSWSETGVGCESCHGPASQHVALATARQLDGTLNGFNRRRMSGLSWEFLGNDDIASPTGIINDADIDTCGGCHSRRSSTADASPGVAYHQQYRLALLEAGPYFSDGQINEEVYVMGSFLQSKMQRKGVTCSNCHNPHSGKLIAEGNALCAQCHKPTAFDTPVHHHHQQDSAGAQCVNCHMPERLYMSVDLRRDHSFPIPDPLLSTISNAPNACTSCHLGKTDNWAAETLKGWGVAERQNIWAAINQGLDKNDSLKFRTYALNSPALKLASIRQATLISKLSAFPSRLGIDTISPQLANPDSLIRRAAVSALQGVPVQLRWQLLNPLIEDPVKVIRFEVASGLVDALVQLTGEDAERLGKLIDEYRESLDYNSDSPAGQLGIGILEARLGYSILAENAYLRALEIEPNFVPALINLSDFYRSTGRDPESRDLLLNALQVAPDSAITNHAYGLYLVRSGKQEQALAYFETAIRQGDSNPRHVYVYAVALDSVGQTGVAINVIDAAGKIWPNNLELSFLQVSYMDKIGKTDGIHRYLSLLASVAANAPQVRAWISKYGASENF
jgi:predicted CXXCH cytochrome family protein